MIQQLILQKNYPEPGYKNLKLPNTILQQAEPGMWVKNK